MTKMLKNSHKRRMTSEHFNKLVIVMISQQL